jgi:predicted DNA-binding transcriptional regulator YafY
MTAHDLAAELDVSERTIYRDVDALSAMGIPIYGEPGPEGGYALLESYRTDLTGLAAEEARALFMLNVPAPLDELGMARSLKTALLKLSAAVSPGFQGDEQRVRQRFYIDAVWWHRNSQRDATPALQALQRGVWDDRLVAISFTIPPLAQEIELAVSPLALVAKAGTWYLVYGHSRSVRVIQVTDLLGVRILDQDFARPDDFDLVGFWEDWCAAQERERELYQVAVRIVSSDGASRVRSRLNAYLSRNSDLVDGADPDREGEMIGLAFRSLEEARARLLPFGGAVEVVAPRALRLSMADYGRRIADVHSR